MNSPIFFKIYFFLPRTIINGLCYLATFVFGINSVGLFLYSGQLAINSFMDDSNELKNGEDQVLDSSASSKVPEDTSGTTDNEDQGAGKAQ